MSDMAAANDPKNVSSPAPEMIKSLPDAFVKIEELLDATGALEILLLGRSGVGKSSFINAMFDNPQLAPVGDIVTAETKEVKSYTMKVRETDIIVYDSPGFESTAGFRKQKKYLKAIKEACKTVDYVFLCIRLDDQLQKPDEDGIKALAKGFGSYPEFWKKMTIIFTRANSVHCYLEERAWQDEVRTIALTQMSRISHLLTRNSSQIVLSEDQYSVAGSPFKPRKKTIDADDSVGSGSDNSISLSDISANPMILRKKQYDDPQEWVPHLIGSLLESDSDGIHKIKLLKTRLTKKEIAAHTTLNGSSAVGVGVGIACCVIGAGVSIAGPIGPAIGIPLITIGATTIAVSATTGVSTNASFIVKGARKMRYSKAITRKLSKSGSGVISDPSAENIDEDVKEQEEDTLL